MFTGIVEGLGIVTGMDGLGNERRFTIRPLFAMENIVDGESIAVNGACLSVEKHGASAFTVYASSETAARTNLGSLRNADKVNLERALKLGDRLGGHIVSGHVDCLAEVKKIGKTGESLQLRLGFPPQFAGQIISKGSVALNGISLTVNKCGNNFLEVNVIPDSQRRTNLPLWKIGSPINMETDIIGKYAQHLMASWQEETASPSLDIAFLARNGFM